MPVIIAPSGAPAAAGSSDIVAIVAADVLHTLNSLTLEDITGLTFSTTGGANELWWAEALLVMNTNSAGSTSTDYAIAWAVSGAQTGHWGSNPETGQSIAGTLPSGTLATTLKYGSVSTVSGHTIIHIRALIRANSASGACQLRFAQNAVGSGSSQALVRADSTLIAKKIRS